MVEVDEAIHCLCKGFGALFGVWTVRGSTSIENMHLPPMSCALKLLGGISAAQVLKPDLWTPRFTWIKEELSMLCL